MHKKQKGSGSPAKPGQISPIATTLAFEPVRARTVVGVSDKTLPPLAEGMAEVKGAAKADVCPFDIELTDKYSIHVTRMIGEGGMGEVFRAVDEIRDRSGKKVSGGAVAVKLLRVSDKALGSNKTVREQKRRDIYDSFVTEVQLVKKLEQDNIIRIFVFGETPYPGTSEMVPFYSMELLRGDSLQGMLSQKGRFGWAELRPLMLQACSGLVAAHGYRDEDGNAKPIIHLDIKPLNIFVTTDSEGRPRVKVLDFGLARVLSPVKRGDSPAGFWGTPDYLAPEQARGEDADHRTDIYALGITMYQLLAGATPFTFVYPKNDAEFADTWARYREVIISEPPAPLAVSGVNITEKTEKMISRCLAKDPRARYQSMLELKAAIKDCNEGAETVAEEPAPAIAVRPSAAEPNGHPYRGIVPAVEDVGVQGPGVRTDRLPRRNRALRYALLGLGGLTVATGGFLAVSQVMKPASVGRPATSRPADASVGKPITEPIIVPVPYAQVPDAGVPPDAQAAEPDMAVKKARPKAGNGKPGKKVGKQKKPQPEKKQKREFLVEPDDE